MPFVFVLARDWRLRAAVRAELRERGIDALGMDAADDAGRAIASGQFPAALVVEGISEFASNPAIQNLIARVPTVWIASRTEKIPEPALSSVSADAQHGPFGPGPPASSSQRNAPRRHVGVVLYRPVRIAEIVFAVLDLLHEGQPA
jgi:hypothetical protein